MVTERTQSGLQLSSAALIHSKHKNIFGCCEDSVNFQGRERQNSLKVDCKIDKVSLQFKSLTPHQKHYL